jgi:hypothetical protein
MLRFLAIIFIGLIINPLSGNAQSEMRSTYYRPSISIVYSESGTKYESNIYKKIDNCNIPSRFDLIRLNNNKIRYTLPIAPKGDKRDKNNQNLMELARKKEMQKSVRELISRFWGRDFNGNFYLDTVIKRAKYTATDIEINKSNLLVNKNNIYQAIADSLLARKYIILFEIDNVKSYEEHYDQVDAKNKKSAKSRGTEFKPIERKDEGWIVNYTVIIYKLDWNDYIQSLFWNELWVDQTLTTNREKRIKNFNNFEFPIKRVLSMRKIERVSQPKDPDFYKKIGAPRRKNMNELIDDISIKIFNSSFNSAMKKINDFQIHAPLVESYPNRVNLGNKEGLKYDQRFYVYRYEWSKGINVKKRVGVLRVADLANNSGIASGQSNRSSLRQQGGKRLYSGDLVEINEDFGFGLYLGYTAFDSPPGGDGLSFGFDYRLSSLFKSRFFKSFHFNAMMSVNYSRGKPFFADDNVNIHYFGQTKVDLLSQFLTFGFSRETYFTKKGNLYITPEIGFGVNILTASPSIEESQTTINEPIFEAINVGDLFAYTSISLGYHLSPSLSFYIKPILHDRNKERRFFSTTDSNDNINTVINQYKLSNNGAWDLENNTGVSLPVFLGLKISL